MPELPEEAVEAARFRRQPDEVDAIRWTGDNIKAVMEFMAPEQPGYMSGFSNADDLVGTPGGVANKGDWIVRRPDGAREIWPLMPSEFEARYEPAVDAAPAVRKQERERVGEAVEHALVVSVRASDLATGCARRVRTALAALEDSDA